MPLSLRGRRVRVFWPWNIEVVRYNCNYSKYPIHTATHNNLPDSMEDPTEYHKLLV